MQEHRLAAEPDLDGDRGTAFDRPPTKVAAEAPRGVFVEGGQVESALLFLDAVEIAGHRLTVLTPVSSLLRETARAMSRAPPL